jgi:hypothetical protein
VDERKQGEQPMNGIRQQVMTAVMLLATMLPVGAAEPQFEQLSWLAGCWKSPVDEPGTVEQWTPLAGGTMLGLSRTVSGGTTVMYEFMRIARDDSGRLSFFAQPRGVAPAGFPAIRTTPTEVVFENPAHDFPQRIVYRFEAPATLRARIEGMIDGKARREDFHFVRGSCESN